MITDKIKEVALKYIGKTEKPNNAGFNDADFEKRMRDVGFITGASWCAFFCELVYKEAYGNKYTNELNTLFSGSATATFKNFNLAKSNGWQTGTEPKIGALAVWSHGNSWQGHIGIVVEENSVSFKSVEGNTNDVGGREGYIVAKKSRITKAVYSAKGLNLIGFIYPKE